MLIRSGCAFGQPPVGPGIHLHPIGLRLTGRRRRPVRRPGSQRVFFSEPNVADGVVPLVAEDHPLALLSAESRLASATRRLFWTCLTPGTRSTQSSALRLAQRSWTVPLSVTSPLLTLTEML